MELKWDLASFPLTFLTIAVLAARRCFHAVTEVDSTTKLFMMLVCYQVFLRVHVLALHKSAKSVWNFPRHRYFCNLTVYCAAQIICILLLLQETGNSCLVKSVLQLNISILL